MPNLGQKAKICAQSGNATFGIVKAVKPAAHKKWCLGNLQDVCHWRFQKYIYLPPAREDLHYGASSNDMGGLGCVRFDN